MQKMIELMNLKPEIDDVPFAKEIVAERYKGFVKSKLMGFLTEVKLSSETCAFPMSHIDPY